METATRAGRTGEEIAIRLVCDGEEAQRRVADGLSVAGIGIEGRARVVVLVDAPLGHAMRALPSLIRERARVVVLTWNRCPEHFEELWDSGAAVVACDEHGSLLDPDLLARLVGDAAGGRRRRLAPGRDPVLSPGQRQVLAQAALGCNNRQIGKTLHLTPRTVGNTLSGLYPKIGVKHRAAALLYFWDIQARFDPDGELVCPPKPGGEEGRRDVGS